MSKTVNDEWNGLSKGSKAIIREKVARAAKVEGAKLFGTGPRAKAQIRAAARKFEDALQSTSKVKA